MIEKIAVVGSGIMGAGIVAHIANAGYEVLLLDMVSDQTARNSLSEKALKRIIESNIIAEKQLSELITIGNIEDDLSKLGKCDWVIEVITENLTIKQQLYQRIIPYLRKNTYISSNTSTFQLQDLKHNLPLEQQQNFYITHFFNPPRYMKLLELVVDTDNDLVRTQTLVDFMTNKLGKTVVQCNDTPGFIANRIGCFLMEHTLRCAIEFNIAIEIIDEIMHKLLGMPKTGVFGLMDLIGLDVMTLMATSLTRNLPVGDRFHIIYHKIVPLEQLITQGFTGRKGRGGFYRMTQDDTGKKRLQVLDLQTWQYREAIKKSISYNDIAEVINEQSNLGLCLKKILVEFGLYVCALVPEICDDLNEIDRAMQYGYNWQYGPFAIINKLDKFGYNYLIDNAYQFNLSLPAFLLDQQYIGIKLDHTLPFEELIDHELIYQNDSAKLIRFTENDIYCFTPKTKGNCLNLVLFELFEKAIDLAEQHNRPLIIYSNAANFSFGADLHELIKLKTINDQARIQQFLAVGQRSMLKMKYAKVPIIACVRSYALGGGCELLLHASHVIANIETYAGLVEVGVGLIPGWGGLKEIILRSSNDTINDKICGLLRSYKTSSAYQLKTYYDVDFRLNMNSNLLLNEAIAWCQTLSFTSKTLLEARTMPHISLGDEFMAELPDAHTNFIARQLLELNNINMIDEAALLAYEQKLFIKLLDMPQTSSKIKAVIDK